MQIPRFFLTQPALDFEPGDTAQITDSGLVNQIRNVLRMQVSDPLILLDGKGALYECTISSMPPREVHCKIDAKSIAGGDPPVDVRIALALIKGERFEWALQKLCEVGVRSIVPIITARTVVKIDTTGDAKGAHAKLARWQTILREAAEQCERATIPQIELPRKLNDFIDASMGGGTPGSTFICAERISTTPLRDILIDHACKRTDLSATTGGAFTLLVGPEGGFTEDEISLAVNAGAKPVSLGPRILRAETAAVYAVAQIVWCLEE